MEQLYKFIAIISLTIPHSIFGQTPIKEVRDPVAHINYCLGEQTELDKPIRADWVQIDVDIIRGQLTKVAEGGSTIPEIKKVLPHFLTGNYTSRSYTYNLNYGLKSTLLTIRGSGYGTFNVHAVYFGDYVLKLRLTIENHKEIVTKYLLEFMTLSYVCQNGMIAYEKTYSENVKKYLSDSGHVFLESADTNDRRREAINYFTDVMTGSTFESPYYVRYRLGSETFDNLRYFIANNDYQALESILFSPGTTSRLLAARTLLHMQEKFGYKPGTDIEKTMKEVLRNAELIQSGAYGGCLLPNIKPEYYDVVKDFESLLRTE